MTNKQIVEAQKLLRRLDGTPVKVYNEQGEVYWQITYDNATYNSLVNIIEAVAKTPIREYTTNTNSLPNLYYQQPTTDYHREKIE
jgi:hypothetical protein